MAQTELLQPDPTIGDYLCEWLSHMAGRVEGCLKGVILIGPTAVVAKDATSRIGMDVISRSTSRN